MLTDILYVVQRKGVGIMTEVLRLIALHGISFPCVIVLFDKWHAIFQVNMMIFEFENSC